MADKLKELMPDKAFKLFMDELKKNHANRKVVTKVIEKSSAFERFMRRESC